MNGQIGSATRPRTGQIDCGDRCGWWATPARIVMAVADGYGHGPEAVYAAEMAMACIGARLERPIEEFFSACDARLRDTRGVTLAVAIVDIESGNMTMASVGNVRTVLMQANKSYHMGSTRGIVGGGYYRLMPKTMAISPGAMLALFSEGLDEFFPLSETLEMTRVSEAERAQTVLNHFARDGDEAAVLIYRHEV